MRKFIYSFIHSVIMKFLIMCSVWYFALRKNGDQDTVPSIKDLRGCQVTQNKSVGKSAVTEIIHNVLEEHAAGTSNLVSTGQGGLSGGGDV